MTQLPPVQLAAIGYDAYGKWVGGKNFQGDAMPAWDALPDRQRMAWIAAAGAIAQAVLAPPVPACSRCGHSALFHDRGADGQQQPVCCFVACDCGKQAEVVAIGMAPQQAVEDAGIDTLHSLIA